MNDVETRRMIRKQLIAAGAPPASVDVMVDLGFHAAQRACEALLATVMAAPGKAEVVQASMIAVGVLRARLEAMEADVRNAMDAAGFGHATISTAAARV